MSNVLKHSDKSTEKISSWFGDLINTIQLDQLMMETATAPKMVSDFYTAAMHGTNEDLMQSVRDTSTQAIAAKVITEYLQELMTQRSIPLKLAFDISPSTILVWAEILEDDDKLESQLILAEAKVNADNANLDFHINSMIVEASDNIDVPPHYKQVQLPNSLTN